MTKELNFNPEHFTYDPEEDAYKGSLVVNGLTYEGTVKSWNGPLDKAWSNSARIFALLEKSFYTIEDAIRKDFIPEVRHWAEDQAEENHNDEQLAELTVEAMKTSSPARFSICAEEISEVYFQGPRFLLGHGIVIQFDENGVFLCVLMTG